MRPALLALLALPACSLINAVDEGRIALERCDDGVDNDADGQVDCRDASCFDAPACAAEVNLDTCTDGRDNDRNGRSDCEEPACRGFAPCQEAEPAACADGLDNDQDGHADCDDAACALFAGCFTASALVPNLPCPALRPGVDLVDELTHIDPAIWQTFSTGVFDAPRVVRGALDPHGVDNFWASGIVTQQQIALGDRQPFRVEVELFAEGGCDGPPGRSPCLLDFGFDTRPAWGDALPFGDRLFTVYVQVLPDEGGGPGLLVQAFYHPEVPSVPIGQLVVPWSPDQVYRLSVAQAEGERDAVFRLDGEELARAQLLPEEPLARFVIQNQLDRAVASGAMLVDRVEIQVAPERPREACRGNITGRPVMPTTECVPGAIANTGMFNPRVLRAGDGSYYLLYGGAQDVNRTGLGLARSADGEGFEDLTPAPGTVDPGNLLDAAERFESSGASGFVFNADRQRFEAWSFTTGSSQGDHLYLDVAPLGAPTAWAREADLVLEGPGPRGPNGERHGPGVIAAASMLRLRGRYLGFYTALDEDGRRSVFAVQSANGVVFGALSEEPVLRPTRGTFDADGIRRVSAAELDGGVVLAYVGAAFGQLHRLGLAYSADGGRTFTKHRDNPLVPPTPSHLDAQGIDGVSLLVEGRKLRLWYQGSLGAVDCPLDQLDVPSYGAFGLVELAPADR